MHWIDRLPTAAGRGALLALLLTGLVACSTTGPVPEPAEPVTDPVLEEAYAGAVALKKEGRIDEARSRFLDIHEQQPELAGPLANLGIIAMEQGDGEAARARFEQVLERAPGHSHALNRLGILARERGDFEMAETWYRKALASDPEFRPALKNLAILLELYRGRLDEALELVERYEALQEESDPTLDGWIFDLKNRMN